MRDELLWPSKRLLLRWVVTMSIPCFFSILFSFLQFFFFFLNPATTGHAILRNSSIFIGHFRDTRETESGRRCVELHYETGFEK